MKERTEHIVKIATFTSLMAAILSVLATIGFRPLSNGATSYGSFYSEKEESLDFVVIGNSTTREGFSPVEVWHEYGLTSHALCSSPTHLEVIKIAIDEIARVQTPKMIYVDINGLTFQSKENAAMYVKDYAACMPEGEAKENLIKEYPYLSESPEFELFAHHNNFRNQIYWESFFYETQLYTKGYYPTSKVSALTPAAVDPEKMSALPNSAISYLKEILEVCKKHPETEYIFGEMPRILTEGTALDRYYQLRSAKSVVEEYGFTYLDWCDKTDEIGLDPNRDQRDENHLNHRGAKKFSLYLGKYVAERYGLGKHTHDRQEEVKNDFDAAYAFYKDKVAAKIEKRLGMEEE